MPDQDQLRLFREYRLRVLTMAQVAIELFLYLTFAWALMVICYGRRNTGHYWMTNGISELLPRFNKVMYFMFEPENSQDSREMGRFYVQNRVSIKILPNISRSHNNCSLTRQT